VYARWVKDSAKFNEWMNPIDYEIDDVPPDKAPGSGRSFKCFAFASARVLEASLALLHVATPISAGLVCLGGQT